MQVKKCVEARFSSGGLLYPDIPDTARRLRK